MISKIAKKPSLIYTLTEKKLVDFLEEADHHYYNTKTAAIEDNIYDIAKERLQLEFPKNKFHESVGSPISKGDKVKLPYWLGSMDKIKPELNNINTWKSKFIGPYAIMDKLDGVSGLFIYTKSSSHLFTRGNGEYGQNISHLIKHLNIDTSLFDKCLKKNKSHKVCIRGELIINKKNFKKFSKKYSNARSATAGIVNAKKPNKNLLKYLEFVAYEVILPRTKIETQLKFLTKLNLNTVHWELSEDIDNENLSDILSYRRKHGKYDIDGIIVCDNKLHPVNDYGNPDFAFAFKTVCNGQLAETTVLEVRWRPSKDGCIVPKVFVVPVKIGGIHIANTTGHNAKYIIENGIGPGATVLVKRAGDVVPNIHKVLKPAIVVMPDDDWIWDKTDTHIYLTDIENNQSVQLRRIYKFFEKLEIANVSKKTCDKLYKHGFKTIQSIITMEKTKFKSIPGFGKKLGDKIFNSIQEKLNNLDLVKLMDSSNCFRRGFGPKKIKSVVECYPDIFSFKLSREDIEEVGGFSGNSAKKFVSDYNKFIKFYNEISDDINITHLWEDGPKFSESSETEYSDSSDDSTIPVWGAHVVFDSLSFMDDHEIFSIVEDFGLIVKRRVTKNTDYVVINNYDDINNLMKYAEKSEIHILTIKEFKTLFG